MDARTLLDFLKLAERLKCSTRHSYTSSGRHESVAEHSWRLALMAYLVSDQYQQLDMNKVIKMCLVHDLGEAVTGDIPAFVKTEDNERDEAQALAEVVDKLPEPHRSELAALYAEMDAQASEEARLYKALDKIEAVIQHNEADIATWLPLEYDLQFTYGVSECAHTPYMKALREAVADDTRRKIDESRQS